MLYSGRDIRQKTFWDVVSASGAQVGVVNWWHSWPALPVNGFVVSDRLFHWRTAAAGVAGRPEQSLTYPEEMLDEVREMATPPDAVTAEQLRRFVDMPEDELAELVAAKYAHHELSGELRFLVALDTSCWRVFEHCLDTHPGLKVAAVYLRGVDIAMHCAFRFMPSAGRAEVDAGDRRKFGRVVPEAYRVADERLGCMMDRMGPQDTLIVLSDHGFAFQESRGEYGHARGKPPGVFYACGPEFAPGRRQSVRSPSGTCRAPFFPSLWCRIPLLFPHHIEFPKEVSDEASSRNDPAPGGRHDRCRFRSGQGKGRRVFRTGQ
jgi:hypothetical protein